MDRLHTGVSAFVSCNDSDPAASEWPVKRMTSRGSRTDASLFEARELRYASPGMKRRIIAAVWITGATIPLLFATIFVAGCCVLPFHGVMHKLMPVCRIAMEAFRLDAPHPDHSTEAPATPAQVKTEPSQAFAALTRLAQRSAAVPATAAVMAPVAATGYRSFITLGAIRCDRDVGLHLLVDTFRI